MIGVPVNEPLLTVTVRELLELAEAADDQDTGSLDAFRAAAMAAVVPLATDWQRLKKMEECDCVPALVSSKSCRKCGRIATIPQKQFISMVGELERVRIVAEEMLGKDELTRLVSERFPDWAEQRSALT